MPPEETNTSSSIHNHSEVESQQKLASNSRTPIRSKRSTSIKLYKLNAQHNKSNAMPPQPQGNILEQLPTALDKQRTCRCVHSPTPSPPPQTQGQVSGNQIVAKGDRGAGVRFANEKDMVCVTRRKDVRRVLENE
jgi:hypothetical protein